MFIIRLVEKHILSVPSFSRPFFEDAIFTDSMFCAKTLPEYGAHYTASLKTLAWTQKPYTDAKRTLIPALSELHCDDFPGHDQRHEEKLVTRLVTQRGLGNV